MRRLIEPVRRGWVLAWLMVVLALSLWAVWSASHADDHADRLDQARATRLCVQQAALIQRINREATDALIDQFSTVERLEPLIDKTAGEVKGALIRSLSAARSSLDRRLDDIPAGQYGRVLDQLQMGQQVVPPVEFVAVQPCTPAGR